jgi:hypothetical protein
MLINTFLGLTADLQPNWPLFTKDKAVSKIQVESRQCSLLTGNKALTLAKGRQLLAKIKAQDLPLAVAGLPVYSVQVDLKGKKIVIR